VSSVSTEYPVRNSCGKNSIILPDWCPRLRDVRDEGVERAVELRVNLEIPSASGIISPADLISWRRFLRKPFELSRQSEPIHSKRTDIL
jgi:hypothetical protein